MVTDILLDDAALDRRFERILADVTRQGWSVQPDFLSAEDTAMLRAECDIRWRGGDFRHAGVGRGAELKIRPEVRSDHVHWLDPGVPDTPQQRHYFATMEGLRQALNRNLYLGLFDFEAFFAVYPPGKFYQKHLDRFRGSEERSFTAVFYLNDDWKEEDGGQLRLYLDEAGNGPWVDVLPCAGTLAVFITEGRWHEVLPATRERMSLTGFFRTR
ncbi:MAG: 2OG-Fe(II) oxygenase [Gammaproteobacteria bacterium HGW-Gammaproteobacteria-1]|jgi:SM-20-related protein|nr:MAG: 2OG-Fe(II) oxygenase [Gammaproteobacteria bacterium HGW-Gammaproteobacteria-1]